MANAVELVVDIVSKLKDSGFKDAETRTSKMKAGISGAAKASAVALGVLGVAAVSSAKAAAEDQRAQLLLANTLKNTGATDASIAATEDWITATSRATAVADDELRPALATLVRATGDVTKSQDAMAVALDVAAATGKPVEAVSKAMAKGFTGSAGALSKLVPGLDKAAVKSADMTKIMAQLADQTGGAAAASANSAAGQWKNFQIQMGEFQESMGAILLPILTKVGVQLGKVAVFAQDNSKAFGIIVGAVAALAAVFVVLNAIIKVATVLQAAYNLVMLANPVVLIVLAIIAAVAALAIGMVLLWQKSETFRTVVMATWAGIKTGAMAAWAVIKTVWDAVLAGGKFVFNWIKANWAYALAGLLMGPFGIAVVYIVKNWDKIKAAVSSVMDAIKNKVETVTTWIGNKFSTMWDGIKGAAERALSPIKAIIDSIRSAIDRVIGAVESLISALGRIKVPKINLPGPLGSLLSAPVPMVASPAAMALGATSTPSVAARSRRVGASAGGGSVVINVTGAIDPDATARQIVTLLQNHDRRVSRVRWA